METLRPLCGPQFQVLNTPYHVDISLRESLSAVFACCAMHLAVLLHKKTVVNWYSTRQLDNIQLLAFFLTTTSVAFFAWYIFYAAYYHIRKCFCS